MRKGEIISLGIILLFFAVGASLYPSMPEMMASHWNIQGEVDGYMPKLWGLFLMPIVSLALFLLLIFIPRLDPLKANVAKFRKYFDNFVAIVVLFLFYLYLLVIFWNKGARFEMIQFLAPAFAVLFYYAGVLTERAKRNWFIGIRTPWTLSNDKVWGKTHELGGRLFKTSGTLALLGIVFPVYAIWFVLAPVLFTAIYTVSYSYFEYRRQTDVSL
jgi:uncharacterized membrane protein